MLRSTLGVSGAPVASLPRPSPTHCSTSKVPNWRPAVDREHLMADATQGDFLMAAKARNQSPAVRIQWNENSIRLAEEEAAANPSEG